MVSFNGRVYVDFVIIPIAENFSKDLLSLLSFEANFSASFDKASFNFMVVVLVLIFHANLEKYS